jgi:hypothetical protein
LPHAIGCDPGPALAGGVVALPCGGKQPWCFADDFALCVTRDRRQRRVGRNDALVGVGDADCRSACREDRRRQTLRLLGATLIDDPPDILADQAGGLDVAFAVRLRLVGHAKQHAPLSALDHRYADQPFEAGKRQPVSAGEACLLGVEEQR